MNLPNLIILMGSESDMEHAQKVVDLAEQLGLTPVMHIASAHKTARHLLQLLDQYEANQNRKVYLTIAGRSNALSGFVDGYVLAPVIACPPLSQVFGGNDIYSSLRMPSGIAPGVVLEPENAALLAAKILAQLDPAVMEKVKYFRQFQMQKIIDADTSINRD